MDSQGFVFLSVLAKFNRIKQLTQETELIRYVCLNSANIEFRMGTDGVDRLRKREGWQQWVLNKEERDLSAQNDGPPKDYETRAASSHVVETLPNLEDGQAPATQRLEHVSYPSPDEVPPFVSATGVTTTNGSIIDGPYAQTPLSATVPDFAPAVPPLPDRSHPPPESQPAGTSCFTDEQVESLMIVVRKPVNATTSSPPPFASTKHRTFSNGSINIRTMKDELAKPEERRSPSTINGDNASEM
jgi:la-related protein 1